MSTEEKKVILKTEGLTKHYGGVKALENADFTLSNGEHVAIVGDNGAGKSTFIRQVTGGAVANKRKMTCRARKCKALFVVSLLAAPFGLSA